MAERGEPQSQAESDERLVAACLCRLTTADTHTHTHTHTHVRTNAKAHYYIWTSSTSFVVTNSDTGFNMQQSQ